MNKKYKCNYKGTNCKATFTKPTDQKRHIQQFHLQARYYCRSCELQRGKIPFSSPRIDRCRPHLVAGCNGVFFNPEGNWKTSWPLFFQKKSWGGSVCSVGSSLEVPILPHPADVRQFPVVDTTPKVFQTRVALASPIEPGNQNFPGLAPLLPVCTTTCKERPWPKC